MRANNGAPMIPTLILTRPLAQSESFAADIVARWDGPLRIIQSPLMTIVPVDARFDAPDAVIFTSAYGVAAAVAFDLAKGLVAWCVGRKTAELARLAGFAPIVGPGDADGLVTDIIAAKPSGSLIHIRGTHSRGDVCARLRQAGLMCDDVVAYDQTELPLAGDAKSALSASDPLIFPLFSPRTAAILAKQGPFAAPIHAVVMSDAVANALGNMCLEGVTRSPRPDGAAMRDATLAVMRAQFGRS